MAIYGTLGEVNIGALSASTADTATDVFVYDTRKDSDGGAWRKRTQHTSWYNETLNTATRGARREFPAVAVIVASTSPSRVTIYDGDDPDMPMWMVFTSNVNQFGGLFNNRNAVSILAVNGSVIWADSLDSVVDVSFIKDNITSTAFSGSWNSTRNVLDRNPTDTINKWINYNGSRAIVGYPINDVAMTVLPNAPIDPSTGLPVPTIAVATNGGTSIIRDTETVANITTSIYGSGYWDSPSVFNKKYIVTTASGDFTRVGIADIESVTHKFFVTSPNIPGDYLVNLGYAQHTAPLNDGFALGGIYGAGLFRESGLCLVNPNIDTPASSMHSHITTTYNTGYQVGNTKGAWLSDTSTASVTGTELNQYGDFSSTTGWGSRTAAWTISGGVATVSSGAGFQLLGLTSGTLTNGRKYAITVNVTAFTAGRLELSQANSSNVQFNLGSTGTKTLILTYTGTTGQALGIYGYGDASYGFTIDNLYVRELSEADRSVNNTGLAVYGTITKTAVATGSNLVGYSGWSSSNYLRRPYISSIDNPGSGNYSIIFWAKCSVSHSGVIWSIRDPNNPGNNWMQLWFDNTYLTFLQTNGSTLQTTSINYYNNQWNCYAIVKSSGIGYMYENGVLKTSVAMTGDPGLLSTCTYTVGAHYDNAYPVQGSLALLRYSLSAPSPEEILKIYNDEKALFQPNSQCTLYGSSDAVTALAYDDSNSTLLVGTSSGRSDFQGLERINNTTTAVTTAISASNGLIAEQ